MDEFDENASLLRKQMPELLPDVSCDSQSWTGIGFARSSVGCLPKIRTPFNLSCRFRQSPPAEQRE